MHIPDDPQAWSQGASAFKTIFDGLRTAIAQAEVAKALGYQLCKCDFPPPLMLTVGTHSLRGGKAGAVYECPKCKFNTASPFSFTRLPGK